jgi:hypothetical protein
MGTGDQKMETMLDAWFKERNTPAAGSPTGLAMIELLKMDATITLEEARAMARRRSPRKRSVARSKPPHK